MNEFWIKFVVNIVIGLIVVIGFFAFWGKSSGVFREGGFIYELAKMRKEEKKKQKESKKNGRDDL